ncbi:MAG: LytTR family DNA-binding domain-containing protein [Sporomusaceae bacterium]|nr:LytTR family DNA-binding domain-containing protein [Sporomusaceae bacterium]
MYQIAICEDESIFAEALDKSCTALCNRLEIDFTITRFQNSEEFWGVFTTSPRKFDLLLLDIIMDGLNGMDLAQKIREKNKEVTIIFVTSNPDFAIQGYEVRALHYLLKPINFNLLEKLIHSDYSGRFQKRSLVLDSDIGLIKLFFADMIALETVNRKVAIYLADQTVYYTGKLSELLEQLPAEQFVRCHQSFAVNLSKIREVRGASAIAVNEKMIPISRSYQKPLQKAFLKQLEKSAVSI